MNQFPETFKAIKFLKDHQKLLKDNEPKFILTDYEHNKTYKWNNDVYTIEKINEIIKEKFIGNIPLLCQIAKYNANERYGCGEHTYLEYTFITTQSYLNKIEKEKKEIREKIYTVVAPHRKEVYIKLNKYLSLAVNEIIDELTHLGWSIERTDFWAHVYDHYCVVDLTIKF